MRKIHVGMIAFGVSLLVGCGTTAPVSSKDVVGTPVAEKANATGPAQSVATNDEAVGLGQIVYSGRDVIDCGRTRRTGSRIPRDVCRPSSFNGLFPSGGINMGTAKESQPGYGNR